MVPLKFRTPVSAGELVRLKRIFSSHGWEDETRFNRFTELLVHLNKDERQLVFQLTEDFLDYDITRYQPGFKKLVKQLSLKALSQFKHLVLLPVKTAKHEVRRQVKSGHIAVYMASRDVRALANANGLLFVQAEHASVIKKLPETEPALIVLIDDFVGSGATAKDAHVDIRDNFARPNDQIVVVSLIGLKIAESLLNTHKIEYIFLETRGKGITDSISIVDKSKAGALMTNLEKDIGVSSDFRWGWEKSEALVNVLYCPNNTFPIYWWPKEQWPNPFER